MPKTRRAGRKNQLRRITARLYHAESARGFSNLIGIDYHNDAEYDKLFGDSVPFSINNNNNNNNNRADVKLREWPTQLHAIDIKNHKVPLNDIPDNDPRRATYLQRGLATCTPSTRRAPRIIAIQSLSTPWRLNKLMCPITPSRLDIPTLSLPPEDESEEAVEEAPTDFPYCQRIIGFINKETSAALCTDCRLRLPVGAQDEWLGCVKHLLVIGDVPTGVICSVCNFYHLSVTRDIEHPCYHCQRGYHLYLRGEEPYRIDSDGNTVITIFHSVDDSLERFRTYLD